MKGFTPAISTALIELTSGEATPGIWVSMATACALCATFVLYRLRPPISINEEMGKFDRRDTTSRRIKAMFSGYRGVLHGGSPYINKRS